MKKIIELIAVCASVAVMALPAFAYRVSQQPDSTVQDPCKAESKTAMYNEFRVQVKADQAKAYELAKKWLACPQLPGEESITAYLKDKFIAPYEKASRQGQVHDLVYVKKDNPKAIEIGKAILVEEPDNLKVLIDLAYAGYASKSPAYTADTLAYAKKAIQLIESGKTLPTWTPYTSKEEALGYLYNTIGSLTVQTDPNAGLANLIKAAQFEGKIKKLPFTYGTIAQAYEAGPYAKLAADYEAKFKGKDESPESKLALANINQVVDRMIDAYARAVALAGSDPANQANKTAWMESLATWYKYRNKSDAGMNEVIAGILAKPLPPEPTPITTLPESTPAGAAAGSTVGSNSTTGVPTGAAPANKPAATPTTPANTPVATPTPAPSPTPAAAKPKPKRNHRRR